TIPPSCSWFSGRPPGRTAGWRSSGAISSKLATTNISEGFPIMWLTAATRTLGNGEARRSTYGRSIATFGQMGRPPISSTLRFSAIPTRPTATLSAILPMRSCDGDQMAGTENMSIEIDHLRSWIGREEVAEDVITSVPVAGLAATLDRDDQKPQSGDELPPLWHWLYFLPTVR